MAMRFGCKWGHSKISAQIEKLVIDFPASLEGMGVVYKMFLERIVWEGIVNAKKY
jgi:hypothetical protein